MIRLWHLFDCTFLDGSLNALYRPAHFESFFFMLYHCMKSDSKYRKLSAAVKVSTYQAVPVVFFSFLQPASLAWELDSSFVLRNLFVHLWWISTTQTADSLRSALIVCEYSPVVVARNCELFCILWLIRILVLTVMQAPLLRWTVFYWWKSRCPFGDSPLGTTRATPCSEGTSCCILYLGVFMHFQCPHVRVPWFAPPFFWFCCPAAIGAARPPVFGPRRDPVIVPVDRLVAYQPYSRFNLITGARRLWLLCLGLRCIGLMNSFICGRIQPSFAKSVSF